MEPIIREFRRKDKNKDRVPVPKSIRDALEKREIDSLVCADFGTDVRYFTKQGWQQQITYLGADDPEKMEAIVSTAQSVNLQKAGRVLLPKESKLCKPEVKELCIEYYGEFIKVSQSEKDRKASLKKNQLALPFATQVELDSPTQITETAPQAKQKPKSLPMKSVPLAEIEIRDQSFLNRESIEFTDLIESLRNHGQQVPVILRGPKPYTIISGFRRIAALAYIKEAEVLAIIYPALDDKRALAISLLENLQRRNLTDYELIRALARMKDRGYNTAELAELVGKGRRIIELYLRVWNSNEPGDKSIKEALKKGEISISAAINAVGKNLTAEQIVNKSVREIVQQAERARGINRGPIYFREFGSGKITLRMKFDKKQHNIDQVIDELEKILSSLRDKRENFTPESQSGSGESSEETTPVPAL